MPRPGSPGSTAHQAFVKLDQIQFVDRKHQVADPEEGADERVALCLRQYALAYIDQDYGELAARGSSRHITRILLVTRRVGDDKGALGGCKEPIGNIDSDPLLTLILEPIQQQ